MAVALAVLALFAGAALQSATGFGFALVAAPALFALLGPREAVTIGVLAALLLNALTLATERRRPQVRVGDACALVAWSLPGLALGAMALRTVPERALSLLVAVAVLAGLALRVRARGARVRPRRWHLVAAGSTSGALATSTSLSGPPLVLCLLARARSPAQLRDTLAAVFVAEAAIGSPALLATGTFDLPPALGLLLLAAVAGQLLGRRAFAWLEGERYERAVLAALAVAALAAIVASVLP